MKNHRSKIRNLSWATIVLLMCACSSRKPVSEASAPEEDLVESDLARETPKAAAPQLQSQRLEPLLFGADGFPKLRRHLAKNPDGSQRLTRLDADFNGDGRIDLTQWMDPTGSWVERESVDLAGRGVMDLTSYFEKNLGQEVAELKLQEFDPKGQGRPQVWRHFANGKLNLRAVDRAGSGAPNYWEHFENGRLVRTERDRDADGKPDATPTFRQVVNPKTSERTKKIR